jgi:hypothetical protein
MKLLLFFLLYTPVLVHGVPTGHQLRQVDGVADGDALPGALVQFADPDDDDDSDDDDDDDEEEEDHDDDDDDDDGGVVQVISFVKSTVSLTATHYPARSFKMLIIHVPAWFSMIFKFIKPMLNETMKQKVTSLFLEGLLLFLGRLQKEQDADMTW